MSDEEKQLLLMMPTSSSSSSTNDSSSSSSSSIITRFFNNNKKYSLPSFLDAFFRGIGQVIFCNSSLSGAIILLGLIVGSPYLGLLATLATLSATTVAYGVGIDPDMYLNGLLGYNACLVGCATAVFIAPPKTTTTTTTSDNLLFSGLATSILGGAVAPFVTLALKPAMGSIPQWTLAFNIIALTLLLRLQPISNDDDDDTSSSSSSLLPDLKGNVILDYAVDMPLKGISEIFVLNSAVGGGIILLGIVLYSPLLGAHTLLGSVLGALSGWGLFGASVNEICFGLWGYNSALTSMGIGVFFEPTMMMGPVILSACGAVATAAVYGALNTVFVHTFHSPILTLPFCFTMTACYVLQGTVPSLQLATNPHSPERNQE